MRFEELSIVTRREAPARAKSRGWGLLIQAGYLTADDQPTALGNLAITRLERLISENQAAVGSLELPLLQTAKADIIAELPGGRCEILKCPQCGYAATAGFARARKVDPPPEPLLPVERVATPGCNTIDSLVNFLRIPASRTAKALLYTEPPGDSLIFAIIRGDTQLSEAKLLEAVGPMKPANATQIAAAGAVPGYASPVGLEDVRVIVDDLIPLSFNMVAGANESDFHLLNTNLGRDYQAEKTVDLTLAHAGDACINCSSPLIAGSGILLAHSGIWDFKSLLLALAETHGDAHGLCLPWGASPADVYLVHLPSRAADTKGAAAEIYQRLEADGVAVLWDDRDQRAGVKFNDADLIGCPYRATIGERGMKTRLVEFKNRLEGTVQELEMDRLNNVRQLLNAGRG